MTDLIERVARAICESEGREWERDVPPAMHTRTGRVYSHSYLRLAKVAIRVMQADVQDGPEGDIDYRRWRRYQKAYSELRKVAYEAWEMAADDMGEHPRRSGAYIPQIEADLRAALRINEDGEPLDDVAELSTTRLSEGPAPEPWRPEVRAFADLMEAELRANDHKPGWRNDDPSDLVRRLGEELKELRYEVQRFPGGGTGKFGTLDATTRIGKEAADIANFAMMIADVCGALTDTPSPQTDQ